MAKTNNRSSLEIPDTHSSADIESASKAQDIRHTEDNIDILRKSWSKKALVIAFTG